MRRVPTLFLLTLLVAACHPVSQADFSTHIAEYNELKDSYDTLVDQLTTWSAGMYDWGTRTGDALCDVKEKNTPDNGAYAASTDDYCGEGDPDPRDPPAPPGEWGEQ